MSYYWSWVNFSDQESIKSSDITEFVKFAKNIFSIYNTYSYSGYGFRDIVLSEDFQENIKNIETIFEESDEPRLEEFKIEFYKKYKSLNISGSLYIKKIYIIEVNDDIEKEKFKTILDDRYLCSYRYHPCNQSTDPFWVDWLPFPNHGGDEESYYISKGLNEHIEVSNSERSYNLKTRNIVLMIDGEPYPITIGRTAHS